jgi:hypothetical protein
MYRPAGVTSYGALIYTEYYYSYGVRPVIVLSRGDIEFENNLTIATFGDISKMGTIVRIESEQFYSIGIVDDNVELLAMYNLNVGNIVYEDGNIIPIVTSVVKQNSKALGFNPDGYPYVGTVEYANALAPYINYMIITPTYTPTFGFNYKSLVNQMLKSNKDDTTPSDICYRVIDDFGKYVNSKPAEQVGSYALLTYDLQKLDEFLIECKTLTTPKDSMTIKKEWLTKIKEESIAKRKPYSALTIDFGQSDNYFIIDEKLFKLLLELINDKNKEEDI